MSITEEMQMRRAVRHWCEFEGLTWIQGEQVLNRVMAIWQPGTARSTMIELTRQLIQELR